MLSLRSTVRPLGTCLLFTPLASMAASASAATPQGIDVGSDGTDGIFHPPTSVEIDLATLGTYDPELWRVVFHYQSVHIEPDVVVTFKNHPSRAPVVWLSQGDVLIEGEVILDGEQGSLPPVFDRAEPGPGGFRGGSGTPAAALPLQHSAGLGPGGGPRAAVDAENAGGGSHGTVGDLLPSNPGLGGDLYGDPEVTWLVGGSGGGGSRYWSADVASGGGGGGAILVASDTRVVLGPEAVLSARGGAAGMQGGMFFPDSGGGSGGAIRIVADEVELAPTAAVNVLGGFGGTVTPHGGAGRVRFEANRFALGNQSVPPASIGPVGAIAPPTGSRTVRIVEVDGLSVPDDPLAGLAPADVDLPEPASATVTVETTHVSLASEVWLLATPNEGQRTWHLLADGTTTTLQPTGGPDLQARVTGAVDFPKGTTVLQVRVVLPGS